VLRELVARLRLAPVNMPPADPASHRVAGGKTLSVPEARFSV